ncbi:MAG: 3D-(3,5/4)-trihydroxycyclohexane-1,2-dione acylhydrolase (decyclizing), partial [Actinomycetota bacterium]|nr:3D-(3,5/4)-trihydroxycyclohexane-1,2-dione acylhydrolase (decyclizing) [Actinomycetota bacterium]
PLQRAQGGASYNNMFDTSRVVSPIRADFAQHAAALGCIAEVATTIAELEEALGRARAAERTSVIVIRTDPQAWSEGGAFWEVGVPETSPRPEVREAREKMTAAKAAQWIGG